MQVKIIFVVLMCQAALVACLDNGVALTPGMGWNSWNHYHCDINEDLIKKTIDAMVQTGLKSKGYQYVNLDDCWQISRDSVTKQIIADPAKFPSGIPALVQYANARGLKLGLYSDAGTATCQGRPGSLGYEEIDAQTYASWGVDYLKYDNCNSGPESPKKRYPVMRDALNKTGRHIYFSMCEWGVEDPWLWAQPVGNSWRTTGDITDNWNSFIDILDKNVNLYQYSQIGAWNDPDMLEVGNGGMTNDEYIAHFSLWALLKAPLLVGCDVTNMTMETLQILGNEEIIAINQDPLGKQGKLISKGSLVDTEVWAGELVNNNVAVILFNRSSKKETISFVFSQVGFSQDKAHIRDLVNHKDLGVFSKKFSTVVQSHQAVVLRLSAASEMETEVQ